MMHTKISDKMFIYVTTELSSMTLKQSPNSVTEKYFGSFHIYEGLRYSTSFKAFQLHLKCNNCIPLIVAVFTIKHRRHRFTASLHIVPTRIRKQF